MGRAILTMLKPDASLFPTSENGLHPPAMCSTCEAEKAGKHSWFLLFSRWVTALLGLVGGLPLTNPGNAVHLAPCPALAGGVSNTVFVAKRVIGRQLADAV